MTVPPAFAVWITGLPASGKSTVTRELVTLLRSRGVHPVVLESDELRRIFTPDPAYTPEERDRFYGNMVQLGELITRSGIPVIFDATAHLRTYRDRARERIPRYLEVLVETPLELCRARDPKGIYASAAAGAATSVPGLQAPYELPRAPELVLDGNGPPERSASRVIGLLLDRRYI